MQASESDSTNSVKESQLLNYIAQIVIFGLFNTIEGYQEDRKFDTERLKKTTPQMEGDELSKACLDFSYGIISKLFEMLINIDDECFPAACLLPYNL